MWPSEVAGSACFASRWLGPQLLLLLLLRSAVQHKGEGQYNYNRGINMIPGTRAIIEVGVSVIFVYERPGSLSQIHHNAVLVYNYSYVIDLGRGFGCPVALSVYSKIVFFG